MSKMDAGFWIEVTSGLRWDKLFKSGVELRAPNRDKYKKMFLGIKKDDVILHYLTTALTSDKEFRSSIVAFSFVTSAPEITEWEIIVNCKNCHKLHSSIHFKKFLRIKKSPTFKKLVKMNMQQYLTEISEREFESIIGIYPDNKVIWDKAVHSRAHK